MAHLTPWFTAVTQPPVRVGWYECRNSPDRADQDGGRRYWNGKRWLERGPRSKPVGFGTWTLDNQWRGLREEPTHPTLCTCIRCNLTRGPIRFGVEDDCDPWGG
jgi:hypothetical protein